MDQDSHTTTAEPTDPVVLAHAHRIGTYAAEHDELKELGWDVRMRVEPIGDAGPAITADIISPQGLVHGRSGARFVCWRLPEGQPRREVEGAIKWHFMAHGRAITWDQYVPMDHTLWLVFYAAWREHYKGRLPLGWPFAPKESNA